MLLQGTNTWIFDCDAFELTEFICDDGFSLTFRISKVLCCQITRLTGTECCRLRGTQECFCSTHMHDSAGSLSDDCHIVRKKKEKVIHFYNFAPAAWCGGVKLQKHVTLIRPSCSITPASLSCSTFFGERTRFRGVDVHWCTCVIILRSACLQLRWAAVPVRSGPAAQTPGQLFTEAQVGDRTQRCVFFAF